MLGWQLVFLLGFPIVICLQLWNITGDIYWLNSVHALFTQAEVWGRRKMFKEVWWKILSFPCIWIRLFLREDLELLIPNMYNVSHFLSHFRWWLIYIFITQQHIFMEHILYVRHWASLRLHISVRHELGPQAITHFECHVNRKLLSSRIKQT